MLDNRSFWTFPVPGTTSSVVVPTDWEGLLLLNPTASWIWQNLSAPDLPSIYASHFEIPLERAKQDLSTVVATWEQLITPPEELQAEDLPSLPTEFQTQDHVYQLNGVTFLIRYATNDLANELTPRLAKLEVPYTEPDHVFVLCEHAHGVSIFRDGIMCSTEPLITAARAILLQELARLAVHGRDFKAILHAGAVGTPEGCFILAGASFSGKSTLCAALMLSGLQCFSDDSAALTTDFQIAGMPFALSLREGSWHLFPHLHQPRFLPSNLTGTPTAPPKGLIFVDYQASAEGTTLEPVDTFDALLALQQSGFWVEHTKTGISAFLNWLSALPVYRLTYCDVHAAVDTVTELLNSPR